MNFCVTEEEDTEKIPTRPHKVDFNKLEFCQ